MYKLFNISCKINTLFGYNLISSQKCPLPTAKLYMQEVLPMYKDKFDNVGWNHYNHMVQYNKNVQIIVNKL